MAATNVARVGVQIDAVGVEAAKAKVASFDRAASLLGRNTGGLDTMRRRVDVLVRGLDDAGTRAQALAKLGGVERGIESALKNTNLTLAQRVALTQQLDRVQTARAAVGERSAATEVAAAERAAAAQQALGAEVARDIERRMALGRQEAAAFAENAQREAAAQRALAAETARRTAEERALAAAVRGASLSRTEDANRRALEGVKAEIAAVNAAKAAQVSRIAALTDGVKVEATRGAALGALRTEEALLSATVKAGNLPLVERIALERQLAGVRATLAAESLGGKAREALDASGVLPGGVSLGRAGGIAAGAIAAGLAIGGLVRFLKSSVEQAADAQARLAELRQAVENTGQSYGRWGGLIDATVERLQRLTAVEDDQARGALARMVEVTGDVAGSLRNLTLVADLAAARHLDLATAGDIVAKAMTGNTAQLNRMGFAGKDATAVIEALRRAVGGFAENEAKHLEGQLKQLTNEWGNLKEEVGNAVLANDDAAGSVGDVTQQLRDGQAWVRGHAEDIRRVTSALVEFIGLAARATVAAGDWLARFRETANPAAATGLALFDALRGRRGMTAAEQTAPLDNDVDLGQRMAPASTGAAGAGGKDDPAKKLAAEVDALRAAADLRRLTATETARAVAIQTQLNAELATGTADAERQKQIYADLRTLKEALGAADKQSAEAEDKRQAAQREAVAALTTLVDLGVARASDLALGAKLETQLRAELDRGVKSLTRQAEIEQLINAIRATRPKREYPTGDQSAAEGAAASAPGRTGGLLEGRGVVASGVAADLAGLRASVEAGVTQLDAEIGAFVDHMSWQDRLREGLATGITSAIGDGIAAGFAAIPKGGLAAGFKALTGALLSGIGAAMVSFGKAALLASKLMLAIKKALSSLNPPAAAIAAVALIAVGSMLQSAAGSMFGGGGGGGGAAGGGGASGLSAAGGDVSIERTRDREDRYTIGTTAGAVGRSGMAGAVQPPESLTRVPVAVRAGAAAEAASAPRPFIYAPTNVGRNDIATQRDIAYMVEQAWRDQGKGS